MVSDDKKTKNTPKAEAVAPKKDATPAKDKAANAAKAETKPKAGKADSSEAAAAPKSYSRGEGQKPVSQAYKDNWNAIFGKKSKKKKR
jgi:hypothetical protein